MFCLTQSYYNSRRNFIWVTKTSAKRRTKRTVAEAVVRKPKERDCVNANQYITHMLAVSLGIKLSDAGRRILLYTKGHNANKSFYSICRGVFPIHELCGAMTAIALAKRDLLGVSMPIWKLLAPAVVVHGMANFRGMKVRHSRSSIRASYIVLTVSFAAHIQMELGYSVVRNANLSMECPGCIDASAAS